MAGMLDLSKPDIQEVIARARTAGMMTYDELDEILPNEELTSEDIDEIVRSLMAMGIELIDQEGTSK